MIISINWMHVGCFYQFHTWPQQGQYGWRYHDVRWYRGHPLELIFGSHILMNYMVMFIIDWKPLMVHEIHGWP